METIDLDISDTNELTFKVQIEGADNVPVNIRLVCEANDVSYMFKAHSTKELGVFDFIVPSMSSKLKEGTYRSRIEVLLENKYFAPVEFNISFKQPIKVVAEAISRVLEPVRKEPQVTITAPIVKKPEGLSTHKVGALKARYESKRKQ